MCGRFSLTESIEKICKHFDATFQGEEWHPRYNIAPGQEILTVISSETGGNVVVPMHWGLIPSWSKDKKIGYRMINARAETLDQKPSYKKPFQKQRCLIPTDGFYEWKQKIPQRIIMKDKSLFALAGLWDRWQGPENEVISCTIITTQANTLLSKIHDRMPVVVSPDEESVWLDSKNEDLESLKKVLKPYPSEKMDYYEVSSIVNSWKNDVKLCINPAS